MPLDTASRPDRWAPQPGPQTDAISADWCPELLYGGAAGGGKSDYLLGDYLQDVPRYGEAWQGVLFRRTYRELEELISRSTQLYPGTGGTWEASKDRWRWPNGATLRLRYLERDLDATRYQGHAYCVAVGTPVLMANGTWRAIERVAIGQHVMTLEGPRRVTRTIPPYTAHCVSAVVRDGSGHVLGEQVHPLTHPVLSSAAGPSSRLHGTHRSEPRSVRANPCSGVFSQSPRGADQGILGWVAYSEDARNDDAASSDLSPRPSLPRRWCVPVVLHEQTARSARLCAGTQREQPTRCQALDMRSAPSWELRQERLYSRLGLPLLHADAQQRLDRGDLCSSSADAYAPRETGTVRDYRDGYGDERRPYGELARPSGADGQDTPPSPGDVAELSRAVPRDGLDTTPTRSRPTLASWVHPYTGEVRYLSGGVTLGTMEVQPCGLRVVADISVEDAAHYITPTGLVNRNCWIGWDELTQWPSPFAYRYLRSRLRSAKPVPTKRIRATANPGGVGHQWVKAEFIDPAPGGFVPVASAETGMDRMFIPSRLHDNAILLAADPDYGLRLKGMGSPELVRAMLDGDWSVVAGAYFPEFEIARHVVQPRTLPAHWTRIRAFDWGSARPFCCLWMAVSDGTGDFPANALVVYREWYGSTGEPNVGLKLPAEAVGIGIKAREEPGEKISLSVCDPAMMKEDGGPSMAERMAGIPWIGADNSRVSGWDQVRSRLVGVDGKPMLYVFSTCANLIRTLPALQHDAIKAEDLDSDGEDHAGDTLRYGCMSRPWKAPLPVKPKPRDTWAYAFARANGSGDEDNAWKVA